MAGLRFEEAVAWGATPLSPRKNLGPPLVSDLHGGRRRGIARGVRSGIADRVSPPIRGELGSQEHRSIVASGSRIRLIQRLAGARHANLLFGLAGRCRAVRRSLWNAARKRAVETRRAGNTPTEYVMPGRDAFAHLATST